LLPDPPHRLDPVELRHHEVHQDDIRREPDGLLDRGGAVGGLADDLDPLLQAEEGAQPLADDLVVVGDHHANRATAERHGQACKVHDADGRARNPRVLTAAPPRVAYGASGASSRTVVPAPAAESIESRPPTRRARSSIELSPIRRARST